MPISIKTDIILQIAGELETGMLVFFHKDTGDLVYYPDESNHPYFEPLEWRKEINKVKKDSKKYLKFETMDAGQTIRMMNNFAGDIAHQTTRKNFEVALNHRKPFQAFKQLLQQTPGMQQSWYQYKTARYIQWVLDQLKAHNLEQ